MVLLNSNAIYFCTHEKVFSLNIQTIEIEEDAEYTLGDSSCEDVSLSELKSPGGIVGRKRPASVRKSGTKKVCKTNSLLFTKSWCDTVIL